MPSCLAEEPVAALLRPAEERLGAAVLGAEPLAGGYTPQRVFRLRLAGGATCVLKAAPPAAVDRRLDWPRELEREIELYSERPELNPWRPGYLGDFSASGWRVLLMEDVGAGVRPSWHAAEVRCAARGLAEFHAAAGGLIHGDVRADNLVLDARRGLILVDWAEAAVGSHLEDVVYWAVGVALDAAVPPLAAVDEYGLCAQPVPSAELATAVGCLLEVTRRRLARPDEPAPVRDLRRRELEALRLWRRTLSR